MAQLLAPPPAPPLKPANGGSKIDPCCANSLALLPQPVCQRMELSAFNARLVPPTAVENGADAGELAVGASTTEKSPWSPVAKFAEIPATAAISEIKPWVWITLPGRKNSGNPM